MQQKLISFLFLTLIFFFSAITNAVVISNTVITGNLQYSGQYQLIAEWNDQTNRYEKVTEIKNDILSQIKTLTITNNTIQTTGSICSNVNFISSPIKIDDKLSRALATLNIAFKNTTFITAKGNDCAMAFIIGDNDYLLMLTHDDQPFIYIRSR